MLQAWLRERAGDLAPDDAAKVESHPIRVLDSKRETHPGGARRRARGWPTTSTPRPSPTASGCRPGCGRSGIAFEVDETLVRGLDYYTHTLFEFQSSALGNAQSTILGGGRYDGLIEQLGGPPTPGIGFGCGHRARPAHLRRRGRLRGARRRRSTASSSTPPAARPRSCSRSSSARAGVADGPRLRRSLDEGADEGGREERRPASRLIVGEDELADGTVTVRDLERRRAVHDRVATSLVDHIRKVLEP